MRDDGGDEGEGDGGDKEPADVNAEGMWGKEGGNDGDAIVPDWR